MRWVGISQGKLPCQALYCPDKHVKQLPLKILIQMCKISTAIVIYRLEIRHFNGIFEICGRPHFFLECVFGLIY